MDALLCLEKPVSEQANYLQVYDQVSFKDPALFNSESRVLSNLLILQQYQQLNAKVDMMLFETVQTEVLPNMRKMVANWMLEVCDTELCRAEVFPHAMNLLDRFLSKKSVHKNGFQLLGAVCLLLASKMRLTRPLTVDKLIMYTDYSVSRYELLEWELLVLHTLEWNMASVIADDLLDHLVHRLPLDSQHSRQKDTLRTQAQTVVALCATEFELSAFAPSLIAAGSMMVASGYVLRISRRHKADMLKWIQQAINAHEDELRLCTETIDDFITKNFPPQVPQQASSTSSSGAVGEMHHKVKEEAPVGQQGHQPETPTDVQDVLGSF